MYLSKDDILKADDLPIDEVDVPEWGGTVRVRGMTGTERDRFELKMHNAQANPDDIEVRAQVVGRCLVDEDGKRMFTDKELVKLGTKSGVALDRLFDKVRAMSGMTKDAKDAAAEDFGDAPDDGSASA